MWYNEYKGKVNYISIKNKSKNKGRPAMQRNFSGEKVGSGDSSLLIQVPFLT